MRFYERDNHLQKLRDIQDAAEQQAQLTIITGRSRSGRTSLLLEATKDKPTLYFYIARKAESILCYEFQEEMQQKLDLPAMPEIRDFRTLLKHVMAASKERCFNVIIDEYQEFNTINQGIYTDLQNIWDRNKDRSHLCLFLVGTDTASSTRVFEGPHAPLAGRYGYHLHIEPFSTSTLRQVLADNYPQYTARDLLAMWAFTGGVQGYVSRCVEAGVFTAEDIVEYVCQERSTLLNEGKLLLIEDFGKEYTIYFSILACIALDITSRSYIEEYIQKEIGGYLTRLETDFHLIKKQTPLFSKSGSKNVRYTISDNFLRFWFRFVWPYQALVERQQLSLLRQNMGKGYEQFTGRTLEQYFQQLAMESGRYTMVGNWWNRKGENEIDMIALNEFDHTGIAAEIKRNPKKLSLSELEDKVKALPASDFNIYDLKLQTLSIEDM